MARDENTIAAPLLSVAEAARFLGVGRKVLFQLLEHGEITAVKAGKTTLVEQRSLEEFKAKGRLT